MSHPLPTVYFGSGSNEIPVIYYSFVWMERSAKQWSIHPIQKLMQYVLVFILQYVHTHTHAHTHTQHTQHTHTHTHTHTHARTHTQRISHTSLVVVLAMHTPVRVSCKAAAFSKRHSKFCRRGTAQQSLMSFFLYAALYISSLLGC